MTVDHDVLANLVGYLLPQQLEGKLEVLPLCKEVERISASLMPQGEQLVVTSTPSFLVWASKRSLRAFHAAALSPMERSLDLRERGL